MYAPGQDICEWTGLMCEGRYGHPAGVWRRLVVTPHSLASMQARLHFASVVLLGGTCFRSYPRRRADIVLSRPSACLAFTVRQAWPPTSRHHIKCDAASGILTARAKSRLEDCGCEWHEACVTVTRYVCVRGLLNSIPWYCCTAPRCSCWFGLGQCGGVS